MNSGWKRVRKRVVLPHVRVHDLKHTFGRHLRSAGVSFEDCWDISQQELLLTIHPLNYSTCGKQQTEFVKNNASQRLLTLLRTKADLGPAKIPQVLVLVK